MADISIMVGAFSCTPPTMGVTYRDSSTYILNYEWLGDLYQSYGLNAKVQLFYTPDGFAQEEFLLYPLPNIANSFILDFQALSFDSMDFKFRFSVEGGTVCEYDINVPDSDIIGI